MDYRTNKILKHVLKEESVSTANLSERFGISERMVKRLVKELNEELESKDLSGIKETRGSLVLSNKSDTAKKEIQKFILQNDFYTYHMIPSERKTIAAMILLNSESYVTAADLSERLEVSRNTLISDLNELKDGFFSKKIKLISQIQKGYQIEGDEVSIRKDILKLLELNSDYATYGIEVTEVFQHLLLKELDYEDRIDRIEAIVKEEEGNHDFYLSSFSFTEVVLELLIFLKRLSMNKIIDTKIDEKIQKSSKYPMSRDILTRVGREFGEYLIPEEEIRYFVQRLRRMSYLKSSTTNVGQIAIPILISEAIFYVCTNLDISFYLDFSLYDTLVDHMKSAIYRATSGETLSNPFSREIQEKYADLIGIIQESLKPIENYINTSFNEDEVSFLVVYYAAMKEKEKQNQMKSHKVSVALVGGMGRGTMQLLVTRLGVLEDVLDIKMILAINETVKDESVELIVSVGAYEDSKREVIEVNSPLISDDEMAQIRKKATDILSKRDYGSDDETPLVQDVVKESAAFFIAKERILLDADVSSWEDSIRVAGRLLYQSGLVEETYVEAMVENVKVHGSYIVVCPELAIPHADKEEGAIEEGISFARLKNPVIFPGMEDNPVRFVIAMSVLSGESINNMLYHLIQMFCAKGFRRMALEAKTEEEVFELIKNRL